jgi:multiple sugar transport system permease protein
MATQSAPLLMRVPARLSRIAWYMLCALLGFTMLLPLLWMLAVALKSDGEVLSLPPKFLPTQFTWSNFITGPEKIGFYRLAANTLVVTALYTIGSVLSSMLAGYAIARIRFPGRQFWFYAIVIAMFVPPIVTLVPLRRLFIDLGFYDTWWPLIIPGWLGSPLFIFLARQFFASIPRDIDDAATLDGANHWQIFRRVMLPLTKPLWITMTIMAVQYSWNDFLNPLVYLQTPEKYTLALGMASFSGSMVTGAYSSFNFYMASNLLYMLPPLILFFLAQRHFMSGLGALGMSSK